MTTASRVSKTFTPVYHAKKRKSKLIAKRGVAFSPRRHNRKPTPRTPWTGVGMPVCRTVASLLGTRKIDRKMTPCQGYKCSRLRGCESTLCSKAFNEHLFPENSTLNLRRWFSTSSTTFLPLAPSLRSSTHGTLVRRHPLEAVMSKADP